MDAKDIEQTSMPLISSLATTTIVAAIYARYSSDRQRDASIEDQIRLCKELIVRMGWVVGLIYIDRQVSGSVVSREGFKSSGETTVAVCSRSWWRSRPTI